MAVTTGWAIKTKKGEILPTTFGFTEDDCFFALFDLMSSEFQRNHWKQWEKSLKSYRKLGYRVVKVKQTTSYEEIKD